MEHLAMVCTNMQNAGFQVLVVSSGAIMLGTAKMGLPEPPTELITKQAIAAIGQADLIKYYQMFFDSFDQIVAQVLLTRDVVSNPVRNRNARMTFNALLDKGIIPIINENDSVSTDDIILDDNYPLTLIVAQLVKPHAIVIKSYEENRFKHHCTE
jgi:glutamate 5-kinase